jgi:hypothetical protein
MVASPASAGRGTQGLCLLGSKSLIDSESGWAPAGRVSLWCMATLAARLWVWGRAARYGGRDKVWVGLMPLLFECGAGLDTMDRWNE